MSLRNSMKCVLAMAAVAAVTGPARAATYDLSLTGVVANSYHSVVPSGGTEFNFWDLSLDGLNASNAITVSEGDVIHATISFDSSVDLPASVYSTNLALFLTGSTFPGIDTGTTATTVALFSSGLLVAGGGNDCTTSSQLAACYSLYSPDNTALAFDKVTADFTIGTLGQAVVLDSAIVQAALANPVPVPEPDVSLLALAGVVSLSLAVRRRRAR